MDENVALIKVYQKLQHVTVEGAGGLRGETGATGQKGETGPSGTVTVATTTTLPAGSMADVENMGSSTNAVLKFSIPRGQKGAKGDAGAGLQITGSVDTYADLPTDLTPADAGKAYFNQADGKLYVWSGTQFPANGQGSQFKGDTGAQGLPGQDGFSPVATVTRITDGATISITDKNGTTTATVNDGTTPEVPTKTSDLTNDSGFVTGSGTVGGSISPVYSNAGVLAACNTWSSGNNWGTIPTVASSDGTMSIGKNLDFYDTTDGVSRTARLINADQNVLRVTTTNDDPGDLQIGNVHSLSEVSTNAARLGATTYGITQIEDKSGTNVYPALGSNNVTTASITDGAVTTAKLAANAVTGAKIDMSTITGSFPTSAQVISLPYGVSGNITRICNLVILTCTNQVISGWPQTGEGTAAETIPVGFRPNSTTVVSVSSIAGRQGNGGMEIYTDGTMRYYAQFNNSDNFRPAISAVWITNDAFPSS